MRVRPMMLTIIGIHLSRSQVIDGDDPQDHINGTTFPIEVDGVELTAGVMLDAQWRWVHDSDLGPCNGEQINPPTIICFVLFLYLHHIPIFSL